MSIEELYSMKLHEEIYVAENENIKVIRVAGGWLYNYYHNGFDNFTTTFVPYNNEFQS